MARFLPPPMSRSEKWTIWIIGRMRGLVMARQVTNKIRQSIQEVYRNDGGYTAMA